MSYTVVSYSDDTKGVGFCKVVVLLGILCRKLYTITRLAWHIVSNPAVSLLSERCPSLLDRIRRAFDTFSQYSVIKDRHSTR